MILGSIAFVGLAYAVLNIHLTICDLIEKNARHRINKFYAEKSSQEKKLHRKLNRSEIEALSLKCGF